MKIEMPRADAVASSRRNRSLVRQHSVFIVEYLERARLLGSARSGVLAARNQDGDVVRRSYAYLMRVHAQIERRRLLHVSVDRSVAIDLMHGQVAGIVTFRIANQD